MTDRYASLKQGLVGCWIPSVSGSGLLLPDLSGRGNNGSLVGMDASDWVSSQYGRALDFDGVNDYVQVTNTPTLSFTSQMTISCWVYLKAVNKFQILMSKNIFSSSFEWRIRSNNVIQFLGPDGLAFNYEPYGTNVVTTNTWYHLAVVCNGANAKGYFNGSQEFSTQYGFTQTSSNLFLGVRGDGFNFPLDGLLDDARIYNRALTDSEIRLLASEPGIGFKPAKKLSRFSQRFTYKPDKPRNYSVIRNRDPNYSTLRQGLVAAYCPSISGQGNVLPDLVGGNHGTLTNMTADDWVASGDGRALDFDGSNDYVNLPSINLTNLFTVSFWYYARTITTNDGLVHEATSTAGIRFNSGIQYYSSNLSVLRIPTAPVGIWTHVAFTRDASGNVIGYLNGINSASGSGTGFVVDGLAYDYLISEARVLDGFLDDVRFYNRALTEPEIKLLASKRGIGLEPRKPKITFTDLGVQKTYSVVRVKETDYGTLRQGLVGAWCPSLPNGGSGNMLPDVSGYGNHGTLTNMSPDDWVSGQYGRAIDFDGSNDHVPTKVISIPEQFTLTGWFNLRDVTNYRAIASDCNSSGAVINMHMETVNQKLGILWGSNPYLRVEANTTLSINQWYHGAIIRFGSSGAWNYRIFLNGKQDLSGTTATNPGISSIFTIGRCGEFANLHCNGRLDDIRIYNRVLTESEIRLLASRPGIGLRQESHRNTFYQFPSGARRKRILTGMP